MRKFLLLSGGFIAALVALTLVRPLIGLLFQVSS